MNEHRGCHVRPAEWMDSRVQAPGSQLLRPEACLALLVLVGNDHFLKLAYPGVLSGKLSDLAGLFLLPVVCQAAFELISTAIRGVPPRCQASQRTLAVAVTLAIVGFTYVELSTFGDQLYRLGMGVLQWPYWALRCSLQGLPLPSIRAVNATPDPTDLIALPLALARLLGARARQTLQVPGAGSQLTRSVAGLGAGMLLALASPRFARAADSALTSADPGGYRHDGFYLDAELGVGALFVDSEASLSNGFQQRIPSAASGAVAPVISGAIAGTLLGLVLGVRIARTEAKEPRMVTLGNEFSLRDHKLELLEVALFTRYYPAPAEGLHFGGSVGLLNLSAAEHEDIFEGYSLGSEQAGVSLSLDAGQSFWLSRRLSAGGIARLTGARLKGDFGTTLLLQPTLAFSLVWH